MPQNKSKIQGRKVKAHKAAGKSPAEKTPKADLKAAKENKGISPKIAKKTATESKSTISAPVFDVSGRPLGKVALPKETFGQEVNEKLMTQALRVYFDNRNPKTASTKTRAEVRGGGRKPHRQKGTGRARAGSIRSPLWVGGGIVFGPKPNDKKLKLSKKMKRRALAAALSHKAKSGEILVVSNFEKMEPKTKMAAYFLGKLKVAGSTLVILAENKENIKLAMRNIPQVNIDLSDSLNAYEVLLHKNLMFEKQAILKFK